jgi:hypothetical protein
MKADVFPPTVLLERKVFPPTVPSELEVPSWVPDSVAQDMRWKYKDDVRWAYVEAIREYEPEKHEFDVEHLAEQADVRASYASVVHDSLIDLAKRYRPLVCDPRMRSVWQVLSRMGDGTFLHPALESAMTPAVIDAKERQTAAMFELFLTALNCRNHLCGGGFTTRAEAEKQRRRYLAKADELEHDALTIMVQHLPADNGLHCNLYSAGRSALVEALQTGAKAYRQFTHVLYQALPSMPERNRDGRARLVAVTIGNKFRALFGQPMYGLTATITSVVLNRRIDPRTVRHWCAPYPAVKPQKIAP